MKLKTEGRSEEIMGWFFFSLAGYTGRKGCSLKAKGGKLKKKKLCVLSMSAIENLLNKYAWTLCYILLLAELLFKDLQKYIFQDLRLIDSSHCTRTCQLIQIAWASLIQQPCTAAASQEMCAQTLTFARTCLCFSLFTKGF